MSIFPFVFLVVLVDITYLYMFSGFMPDSMSIEDRSQGLLDAHFHRMLKIMVGPVINVDL